MADHPQRESQPRILPEQPVDRLIAPIVRFLHVQTASGVVLLVFAAAALILANSAAAPDFHRLWETPIAFTIGGFQLSHTLREWINDGLMVIFFFVIGLEVKRELVQGELRDARRAALPIAAAAGGMLVPALIYLALQAGQPGERGWGIPMATDIAFVVGCMALLGPRVPHGLRIMLLSLAIADDIGAIMVIAIGYTEEIHWNALLFGLGGLGMTFVFARLGVRSFLIYTILGVLVWLGFHKSGIHATIAGVILGLMTPARSWLGDRPLDEIADWVRGLFGGDESGPSAAKVRHYQQIARETVSPLEYLETALHPWVAFLIMPVFAVANAGVAVHLGHLTAPVAVAVALGLLVGKPVGIVLLSWLAVKLGLARLPDRVTWPAMVGGGCLAGIGFTMALFIAGLAFEEQPVLLDNAKIGILTGSVLSAMLGMIMLRLTLPQESESPSASSQKVSAE